tara:strand:- start:375 stop:926 length:552 start_codon:yes stop_codon:yes gene_type:complete
MKDWKTYCKAAFNGMRANRDLWKEGGKDVQRSITHAGFYCQVFCSGYNRTGLISEAAYERKMKGQKVVEDHVLSPQFIGRMIMEAGDYYLENYDRFEELFSLCRQTIVVTQEENDNLSFLTKNVNGEIIILVPTIRKYQSLKINLRKKVSRNWFDAIPTTDTFENLLTIPEALTVYETNFIPE